MGAWGIRPLENDTALDWLSAFQRDGLEAVREVLNREEIFAGYLEADVACEILAAAEVLYALKNGPRDGFPGDLEPSLERCPRDALAPLCEMCARAVDVSLSPDSELFQLWQEADDDFELWLADARQLRAGLTG